MGTPNPPVAPGPGSAGLRRRKVKPPEGDPRFAWGLFLAVGLPFGLMGVLTILARAGIYIHLFSPLWQPWPPEVLKPFIGLAGFAATLAYLSHRIGHRSGYRSGTLAGIASARNWAEGRFTPPQPESTPSTPASAETPPVDPSPTANPAADSQPPPPPPEESPSNGGGAAG